MPHHFYQKLFYFCEKRVAHRTSGAKEKNTLLHFLSCLFGISILFSLFYFLNFFLFCTTSIICVFYDLKMRKKKERIKKLVISLISASNCLHFCKFFILLYYSKILATLNVHFLLLLLLLLYIFL